MTGAGLDVAGGAGVVAEGEDIFEDRYQMLRGNVKSLCKESFTASLFGRTRCCVFLGGQWYLWR